MTGLGGVMVGGIFGRLFGERKPTTGDDLSELREQTTSEQGETPIPPPIGRCRSARGCEAIMKLKRFGTSATTAEGLPQSHGAALAKAKMVGRHPLSFTVFADSC